MKPTTPSAFPACRAVALAKAGLLLSALLLAGCQSGPYTSESDRHPGVSEASATVVLMSAAVRNSIASAGDRYIILPDGRLRAFANLRNREGRRIQVQVQCVFKDEQGFSHGDETYWTTLDLTENATETVEFTSMNSEARKYTFRVREIPSPK